MILINLTTNTVVVPRGSCMDEIDDTIGELGPGLYAVLNDDGRTASTNRRIGFANTLVKFDFVFQIGE